MLSILTVFFQLPQATDDTYGWLRPVSALRPGWGSALANICDIGVPLRGPPLLQAPFTACASLPHSWRPMELAFNPSSSRPLPVFAWNAHLHSRLPSGILFFASTDYYLPLIPVFPVSVLA